MVYSRPVLILTAADASVLHVPKHCTHSWLYLILFSSSDPSLLKQVGWHAAALLRPIALLRKPGDSGSALTLGNHSLSMFVVLLCMVAVDGDPMSVLVKCNVFVRGSIRKSYQENFVKW
jgi:hypothetical protein